MASINDGGVAASDELHDGLLSTPEHAATQHPHRKQICTPHRRLLLLLAAFTCLVGTAVLSLSLVPRAAYPAAVVPSFYTYPCAAGANTSSLYTVTVCTPVNCSATCVYENSLAHRQGEAADMAAGQAVAFAAFAFTDPVTVRVDAAFDVQLCTLRPAAAGLACDTLSPRSVGFRLTAPMVKLSVELYSPAVGNSAVYMMHPLLLFGDPPEDPATIPSPSDPTALRFEPGLHVLGYQMPLYGDVTQVYLAPGAYVIGGFITASNGAVRITGRGVLSGEVFPWHSPAVLWGLININRGSGHLIDGITIIDSPMFYIASVTRGAVIRNVKCAVAWPYNSDGLDVGDGALVEDVFIRSNDDSIKISGSGGIARRITVWQLINGAVVQMGWVNNVRHNVLVEEIDVIHVDYCFFNGGTWCAASDNEAVIDSAPDGVTVVDTNAITIQNVRVEGDAVRLLYLALPSGASGSMSGVSIINVTADSQSLARGQDYGLIAGGSSAAMITGVTVQGMTIGGVCASSAAAAGVRVDAGTTAGIVFQC